MQMSGFELWSFGVRSDFSLPTVPQPRFAHVHFKDIIRLFEYEAEQVLFADPKISPTELNAKMSISESRL